MDIFEELKLKINGKDMKVVFPEANDPRVLGAAVRLKREELINPILVGDESDVKAVAAENGFVIDNLTIYSPDNYPDFDEMVNAFVECRKGKVTEDQARTILLDANYFGTMLTYLGVVDGMVSGAVHSTGDTVRPALQIIKTKPGVSRTSGAFLMVPQHGGNRLIFSDCAINISPNEQELAEIAVSTISTAKLFGIEPKVAMLSFSTHGSASGELVEKVVNATKIAQELAPDAAIDGELQFDAAFVPSVGKQKAPNSKVAGEANVFIFPDIQSGNIGYKIAQRLGNFEAIGPILQGLNKPISDLSRGCNEEDVYKLAIITASQAIDS